ncbi:SGNH/GDSL hydrolase family protein [Christiangramia sediminis]|uniref:SGNH/GDSL hydrolase family protein n=1 Tax=Christiangramia sediminis TaxID=2881336 RepID=A0A9X1LIP3_9FLAO|nr:SGNH/GDSL hydrolase family protein [Christiangramia sediminis]MCB7481050.1 SGNH/GDSL hydrolase family protein [Christiangramia sediminis]
MRNLRVVLLLTAFLIFGISFSQNSEIKILFIGNSLTYTNDLPKLVENTAVKKGIHLNTEMIAHPNYALIDHWRDGKVQKLISGNNFDLVIIQQGPSSQKFGRDILIEYGKKFSELCKNNKTRLAYFMVWPSLTYYHTFDEAIKNHKEAAKINNALLFPVGEVWKKHFEATGDFDYYSADGFHPSKKGSKLAAKIIVEELQKLKISGEI